jgi:hypothetical protein
VTAGLKGEAVRDKILRAAVDPIDETNLTKDKIL